MADDFDVAFGPLGTTIRSTIPVFHKNPFLKFSLQFIFIVERVNWSPRLKSYENSVH